LRRAGIEACLALPLVDPGPRYVFGTSVGIRIERFVSLPASRPSRLGRENRTRQAFQRLAGMSFVAVATAGRHNDRQFGGPAVGEFPKISSPPAGGDRRFFLELQHPEFQGPHSTRPKNIWLMSSKRPAPPPVTRDCQGVLRFGASAIGPTSSTKFPSSGYLLGVTRLNQDFTDEALMPSGRPRRKGFPYG
jgi:hypothetical protein